MLFDRISNSTYFTNSSIIIFFTKKDLFREKISSGMSPVHKYFPDYQGTPTDVSAAQEFFSTKFKNVVRQQHKEIYVYFVNSTDSDIFKKLEDSVKDMSVGRKSVSSWPSRQVKKVGLTCERCGRG
jgi:guanine nucleotide-binding protein subunit alpha, other